MLHDKPYFEARRIYHALEVGKAHKFTDKEEYKQIRSHFYVVRQREKDGRIFKSSEKSLSIWRVV